MAVVVLMGSWTDAATGSEEFSMAPLGGGSVGRRGAGRGGDGLAAGQMGGGWRDGEAFFIGMPHPALLLVQHRAMLCTTRVEALTTRHV